MRQLPPAYLYTTDLCVQTMHTQKTPPDSLRLHRPQSCICSGTTDRQKSDPQRFSDSSI